MNVLSKFTSLHSSMRKRSYFVLPLLSCMAFAGCTMDSDSPLFDTATKPSAVTISSGNYCLAVTIVTDGQREKLDKQDKEMCFAVTKIDGHAEFREFKDGVIAGQVGEIRYSSSVSTGRFAGDTLVELVEKESTHGTIKLVDNKYVLSFPVCECDVDSLEDLKSKLATYPAADPIMEWVLIRQ